MAEATIDLAANSSTSTLVSELKSRYPQLEALIPRCALSVNSEYATGDVALANGDEVAVLPPMSGG